MDAGADKECVGQPFGAGGYERMIKMRQVKDGWHTVAGYNNAWSNERMTMDAFRAGIKRGTVTMK